MNLAPFLIALGLVYGGLLVLAAAFPPGIARAVVAFPAELGRSSDGGTRPVGLRARCCLAIGPVVCIAPINVVPVPAVSAFIVTTVAWRNAVTMIPVSSRRAACPTDSGLLPRYLRLVE